MRATRLLPCCLLATLARADSWDDFSNNLASDLAPILALFGEQVTKQFLSESTTRLDSFIFAMVPLGILTAVVSAVRVRGGPSLRAFVGRAQEGGGVAEAELCSSTSRDVCELYHNGAVVRVFGRPKIAEIVHDDRGASFYGHEWESGDTSKSTMGKAGLYSFQEYIKGPVAAASGWREIRRLPGRQSRKSILTSPVRMFIMNSLMGILKNSDIPTEFAPNPNLSLNYGIKKHPRFVSRGAACVGFALQASVLWFAALTTYKWRWKKNDTYVANWSFPMMAAGTMLQCTGMYLCAHLVEASTKERVFRRKSKMVTLTSSRLFVVQPGNQVVGDQTFDSFSYSDTKEPLREYTTSWKDPLQDAAPKTTAACVAVTMIGFILQFVGLRAMHSAVSVFQLGAILAMSLVRSMLRTQRLAREQNLLHNRPDQVPGYELDWLAIEIDNTHYRVSRSTKAMKAHKTDTESSKPIKPSLNKAGSGSPTEVTAHQHEGNHVKRVESNEVYSDETVHICAITCSGPATLCSQTEKEIRIEHTNWIKELECAKHSEIPHCGARMFYYRARLARLTSQSMVSCGLSNAWGDDLVKARSQANLLKQAIESSAEVLLSDSKLQSNWRGARVFSWSFNADAWSPGAESWSRRAEELPESAQIHLSLKRSPVPGNKLSGWNAENASLEAVIGLFAWSIISHQMYEEEDGFGNKVSIPEKWPFKRILAVSDSMHGLEKAETELNFWTEDFPVATSRGSLPPLGDPRLSTKFRVELRVDRPTMLARQFFPLGLCVGTKDRAPHSEPESLKLYALAAYTNSRSPAVFCAHEVYLSFIVAATATITSIGDKVTISSGRDGLFLDNDLISKLVDCFASSGLGSRQDAYLIIVSALRSRGLLKISRETLLGIIHVAETHQVAAEYDTAQEILQWVWDASVRTQGETFENLVHEEQGAIILAIGELYRRTMWSSADFSNQGFQWMQDVKDNTQSSISRAARDIVDRYLELSNKKHRGLSRSNASKSISSSQAIMAAISDNERVETLWLISQESAQLLSSDSDGRTVLSWAAERGWIEVVKHTLQLGSKIDERDNLGRTALSYAAANGHADTVTLLMNYHAAPSLEDSSGRSVLSYAAASGSVTTIKALLSDGRVAALTMDTNDQSPLYYAAEQGATDAVKYLLKSKVNTINEKSSTRDNPFIAAIVEGHHETAQVLVDHGAKWDMDIGGMRPWQWAITNGRWITAELLLGLLNRREEQEEDSVGVKSRTAISVELRPHFRAGTKIFFKKAALVQMEALASQGGLVLRQFDGNGNEVAITSESVEMLLSFKLNVGYREISGTYKKVVWNTFSLIGAPSPCPARDILPLVARELGDRFQITEKMLAEAASIGNNSFDRERLKTLLKLGGDDIRLTDSVVECVVRNASCLLPFMDLLLEHKGSSVPFSDGNLRLLAVSGHTDLLRAIQDKAGRIISPELWRAAAFYKPADAETARRLLEDGADPNALSLSGKTPLMNAISAGQADVVRVLLDWPGIDVNTRATGGPSALHEALSICLGLNISKFYPEIFQMLLEAGADLHLQDGYGRTPMTKAISLQNWEAVGMMRKYE